MVITNERRDSFFLSIITPPMINLLFYGDQEVAALRIALE